MISHLIIVFLSLILINCGNITTYSSNLLPEGCDSNSALILVWDGHFENFCGCEDAGQNGTVQSPPSALSCKVTSGKTVYFQIMGNTLYHQIISTDSPKKFEASFVHKPNLKNRNWPYAIILTETSVTYNYQDAFNSAMTGQIIVP